MNQCVRLAQTSRAPCHCRAGANKLRLVTPAQTSQPNLESACTGVTLQNRRRGDRGILGKENYRALLYYNSRTPNTLFSLVLGIPGGRFCTSSRCRQIAHVAGRSAEGVSDDGSP